MSGTLGEFGFFFGGIDPSEYAVVVATNGAAPNGRVYITKGGERVDQIAQEVYGFQVGAVESLLIANPGLADRGYELVEGISIFLPELTSSAPSRTPREVALWG